MEGEICGRAKGAAPNSLCSRGDFGETDRGVANKHQCEGELTKRGGGTAILIRA